MYYTAINRNTMKRRGPNNLLDMIFIHTPTMRKQLSILSLVKFYFLSFRLLSITRSLLFSKFAVLSITRSLLYSKFPTPYLSPAHFYFLSFWSSLSPVHFYFLSLRSYLSPARFYILSLRLLFRFTFIFKFAAPIFPSSTFIF